MARKIAAYDLLKEVGKDLWYPTVDHAREKIQLHHRSLGDFQTAATNGGKATHSSCAELLVRKCPTAPQVVKPIAESVRW